MITIMVGDDGRLIAGETLMGPDWASRAAWDHVIEGVRQRATEAGADEFMLCEGDTTRDAIGDMSGRASGLWHTVYHERNGVVLLDRR